MGVGGIQAGEVDADEFRHEVYVYAGQPGFLVGALPFVRDALAADEPIMVATGAANIELLRSELDSDAARVRFADMTELGRNPNLIIPAWQDFLAECGTGGRRVRGIGEQIWAGRSDEELIECERHELLLNLAFAGGCAWWLLCPYDAQALDPAVIDQAHRSHPFVFDGRAHHHSTGYTDVQALAAQLDEHPLPEPARPTDELSFGPADLSAVRHTTVRYAAQAGLDLDRTEDLVLAVNELATNSVCHGGGRGILRVWQEETTLVCEVRDAGHIEDPLVGRYRPAVDRLGGRGLWLVNQLCELVQLRSSRNGTVVRLRVRGE